jgi:hypothetical protein
MPGAAVHPVLAFERRVPTAITKHLAFRMMVVLGATLRSVLLRYAQIAVSTHMR